MALVCEWCNQEMNKEVGSCTGNAIISFPDGQEFMAVSFVAASKDQNCPSCGIKHGGFHHPGCDWERCPRCGGQLIGCGCLNEDQSDVESIPN